MDPLAWKEGRIRFLDQTRLPAEVIHTETDDPEVVIDAIRRLAIRGAPLIGIAGAYACALAAQRLCGSSWEELDTTWSRISGARPTAVNLPFAVARIRRSVVEQTSRVRQIDVDQVVLTAIEIHEEERWACERIAENGAALFPKPVSILTHCNTGALATGGKGTAFGIIRALWEAGRLEKLFIDETRPLFQGARLTAWEATQLGIPCTIITDSTAATLMKQGRVHVVIVGADRIARNGDVANKIGTYGLAVLSRVHAVKFIVAAPVSTIDDGTKSGKEIAIENRSPDEITKFGNVSIAPHGVGVYAPAFDVTPSTLVDAIVTDRGVCRAPLEHSLMAITGTVLGS